MSFKNKDKNKEKGGKVTLCDLKRLNFWILVGLLVVTLDSEASKIKNIAFYVDPNDPVEYVEHSKKFQNTKEWWLKLDEFAQQGIKSAIQTVAYATEDKQTRHGYLHDLAVRNNAPAAALLGKLLLDENDPQCLNYFNLVSKYQGYHHDKDIRFNHAIALLTFKQKDKGALEEIMTLLEDWERLDGGDEYLLASYCSLLSNAQKLKATDFIDKFIEEPKNDTKAQLQRRQQAFHIVFKDTSYMDRLTQRGMMAIKVKPTDTVVDILSLFFEQSENFQKRFKERQESVPSIIKGNLYALLQDKTFRSIPQRIKGFNLENPSLENFTHWARRIINEGRDKLIDYTGEDVALQDLLQKTDNVTLEKYVIEGFKEIFSFE